MDRDGVGTERGYLIWWLYSCLFPQGCGWSDGRITLPLPTSITRSCPYAAVHSSLHHPLSTQRLTPGSSLRQRPATGGADAYLKPGADRAVEAADGWQPAAPAATVIWRQLDGSCDPPGGDPATGDPATSGGDPVTRHGASEVGRSNGCGSRVAPAESVLYYMLVTNTDRYPRASANGRIISRYQ